MTGLKRLVARLTKSTQHFQDIADPHIAIPVHILRTIA